MFEGEPLPDEFRAALAATADRRGATGAAVHFFSETTSTNDVASALAERGAPSGTVVVAVAQTAGRGRLGRTWFSPPGAGLYVSLVCREPPVPQLLTLAAGVALADGIREATGLSVEIKWPNDIVVPEGAASGRRRKLAGILAESSVAADGAVTVILGYGINVGHAAYPLDIADRATSLEAELGRPADAGAVLAETLAALSERLTQLARNECGAVLDRWRVLAPTACGARVRWDAADGPASGVTQGIDDAGALLVRSGGGIHRLIAGEVHWG